MSVGAFTRLAAVVVGLVNLAFVAGLGDADSALRRGELSLAGALPSVIVAVVAGLLTAELLLRSFGPRILSERFAERYGAPVFALCLGGALTGALLAGLYALDGTMFPAQTTMLGGMLLALLAALEGAVLGLLLGLGEGLVLGLPLAAVLGLYGDASRS